MLRIVRRLVDLSQGHCYGPRVCLSGSPDVWIEGFQAVRAGLDNYFQNHNCGHSHHDMGIAAVGSPNIFINGFPMHRSGDLIACGDRGGNGSTTVFAN